MSIKRISATYLISKISNSVISAQKLKELYFILNNQGNKINKITITMYFLIVVAHQNFKQLINFKIST